MSVTYLMYAPECINLGAKGATGLTISYTVGVIFAAIFLAIFLLTAYRNPAKSLARQNGVNIDPRVGKAGE